MWHMAHQDQPPRDTPLTPPAPTPRTQVCNHPTPCIIFSSQRPRRQPGPVSCGALRALLATRFRLLEVESRQDAGIGQSERLRLVAGASDACNVDRGVGSGDGRAGSLLEDPLDLGDAVATLGHVVRGADGVAHEDRVQLERLHNQQQSRGSGSRCVGPRRVCPRAATKLSQAADLAKQTARTATFGMPAASSARCSRVTKPPRAESSVQPYPAHTACFLPSNTSPKKWRHANSSVASVAGGSLLPEGGSASESCAMTRGGRRRSTRPGPAEPSRRKCACITEGITYSSALHRSGSRHRAGDPSLPLSLAVSV